MYRAYDKSWNQVFLSDPSGDRSQIMYLAYLRQADESATVEAAKVVAQQTGKPVYVRQWGQPYSPEIEVRP